MAKEFVKTYDGVYLRVGAARQWFIGKEMTAEGEMFAVKVEGDNGTQAVVRLFKTQPQAEAALLKILRPSLIEL